MRRCWAMQALLNRKGFGRLALRQVLMTLGFLLLTLPINQKTLLFTEQVLPLVRKMDAMDGLIFVARSVRLGHHADHAQANLFFILHGRSPLFFSCRESRPAA